MDEGFSVEWPKCFVIITTNMRKEMLHSSITVAANAKAGMQAGIKNISFKAPSPRFKIVPQIIVHKFYEFADIVIVCSIPRPDSTQSQ